jgi:hypothetical protein
LRGGFDSLAVHHSAEPGSPTEVQQIPGHLPGNPGVTKRRVALAFVVAVVTDILQIPIVLAMFSATASMVGVLADTPLEAIDVSLDIVAAILISRLIGFHWLLLPSFIAEAIPGLDAAPTWTLCVAWVAHRRKADGRIIGKLHNATITSKAEL